MRFRTTQLISTSFFFHYLCFTDTISDHCFSDTISDHRKWLKIQKLWSTVKDNTGKLRRNSQWFYYPWDIDISINLMTHLLQSTKYQRWKEKKRFYPLPTPPYKYISRKLRLEHFTEGFVTCLDKSAIQTFWAATARNYSTQFFSLI